jgi:cystathionine gamma-synthase
MRRSSLIVHAGLEPDPTTGAIAPGFEPSTIYRYPEEGYHGAQYGYSRNNNPGRERLEHALAALEGGEKAAAFGSGMAAIQAVIQSLGTGKHVIAPIDVYHGTRTLLNDFRDRWGLELSYVDMSVEAEVREAFRDNTALLWLESPSNPMLNLCDISLLSDLAREHGVSVCVDNTWPSPILQQPIALGADLVMHSTTKYLGGHSDLLGGIIIGKTGSTLFESVKKIQQMAGAVPSPFDCWLLLRSIRTLGVRVKQQVMNAKTLVHWLGEQAWVDTVYYPGLPNHPGHAVAKKQMSDFGAMISFTVKLNPDKVLAMVSKSTMITPATSLGGVESTWEHRFSTEGPLSKTPDTLIRLSVGIEDVDDLIEDIHQAYNNVC